MSRLAGSAISQGPYVGQIDRWSEETDKSGATLAPPLRCHRSAKRNWNFKEKGSECTRR